jgi:hypothetical protein
VYKPIESILGQAEKFLQHVVILGCFSSFGFADEVLKRSVLITCIILTNDHYTQIIWKLLQWFPFGTASVFSEAVSKKYAQIVVDSQKISFIKLQ